MKTHYMVLALVLLLLVGCAGEAQPATTTTPQETSSPTKSPLPAEPTATISSEDTPATGAETLRIWLPPQFDPAGETPAGDLLQKRLDQFIKRRPGVGIEVRVKAVTGVGGLLDALSTTSAAAPLALPNLVALPRELMEAAVLKGLLSPYDGLSDAMEADDWYGYAQELARVQESVYGLPFAGDALILVYRSDRIETPPADWAATLELASPLVYPAADPMAWFTLALYQASGGAVSDETGGAYLDSETLSSVFSYYVEAEGAGVMPFWLTQYQSDEQVWEAFFEERSDMLATWGSRYLQHVHLAQLSTDTLPAKIPTQRGSAYTLATGWVWTLITPQSDNQELSVELAEFLTDGAFLAGWTQAAGYLPTQPSALDDWLNDDLQRIFSPILLSAHLLPPFDIQPGLGLAIQQAGIQILKQQADPLTAAQAAAGSLAEP